MRAMRSATSRLKRVGAAVAVCAGLGLLAAQPALADDWRGRHGHHHHHHQPRVFFNYGPPVYYAPPPVVYRPAYVYPAPTYYAPPPALGLSFQFR